MRRELGHFQTTALVSLTLRVGAAAAVMAGICAASMYWLLPGWETSGFWLRLAWLLTTILVAGSVFVACAMLFKVSELTTLTNTFKRRLNRATAR